MTAAASPAAYDFAKFSRELEANLERGIADISAATRSLTRDRLGVSDEFINHHIRSLLALRNQTDTVFYERVGGRAAYEAMTGWAKDAYTPDQKARFNATIKNGREEIDDALDLLRLRYARAISTTANQQGS